MSSFTIIPYHDPLEDGIHRLLFGGEGALEHEFIFQAGPQALDHRVVPAVSHAAHAALERELGELVLVVFTGVLAAAIGVMKDRMLWASLEQGHLQGLDTEIGVERVFDAPSDDPAAEQIDDSREVQKAFIGMDVGNVSGPFLIGAGGGEITVESILKHRMRMIGVGGADAEFLVNGTLDAIVLHVFGDGVDAAVDALIEQIPVNIGASVATMRLNVCLSNGGDDRVALKG